MHQPYAVAPRPRKHLFTGAALALIFGGMAFAFGAQELFDDYRNPEPTVLPCSAQAFEDAGRGRWVEISGCDVDIEGSVEVFNGDRVESLYLPLIEPDSGQPVALLKTDDSKFGGAFATWRTSTDDGAVARAEARISAKLYDTPVRGLTASFFSDRELLSSRIRGFDDDDNVIEHERAPNFTIGMIFAVLGLGGLVGSAWAFRNAKRAKAEDEVAMATWYHQQQMHHHHLQQQHLQQQHLQHHQHPPYMGPPPPR